MKKKKEKIEKEESPKEDVILHRLLGLYLDENKTIMPKLEKLENRCLHLSEREKKAQKAERDSIKYMQCIYMSEHIGKVFEGMVSSVAEYGVFVEILENKCDCLVKLTNINGTWLADVDNHRVKEFNTGATIRLGDIVHVVISKVDVEKKNIDANIFHI
jgi:exoribonuclease R